MSTIQMESLADDINNGCSVKDIEAIVDKVDFRHDKEQTYQYGLNAIMAAIKRGSTSVLKVIINSTLFQRRRKQILCNEIPALIYYTADVASLSSIKSICSILATALPSQNINEAIQRLNEDGFSALHLAAIDGNNQAAKHLVQIGADPKQQSLDGNTALTLSIACKRSRFWKFILPSSNVNSKDEDGDTPLMFAAWRKEPTLVSDLIEAGADINAVSRHGSTALWNAVYRSCPEVVLTLLKANADMKVCCEGTYLFLEDGFDKEESSIKKIYVSTPRSILWVAIDRANNTKREKDSLTIIGLLIESGYDLKQEKWIKVLKKNSSSGALSTQDIPKTIFENKDLQTFLLSLYRKPQYLKDICRDCVREIHRMHHSEVSYSNWVYNLGVGKRMSDFLTLDYLAKCL